MKYKLVIFDMDGTILNTLEDLTDSTNATLEHFGYPVHSIEDVRHFVGNGIRKLIERAVPSGLSTERIDEVHRYFLDYYAKHCADKTKPYDGILDLIRTLRKEGCKTAVVSNKADMAVQELCKDYFDGLFDFAVGEREGVRRKPAPDAVEHVLEKGSTKRLPPEHRCRDFYLMSYPESSPYLYYSLTLLFLFSNRYPFFCGALTFACTDNVNVIANSENVGFEDITHVEARLIVKSELSEGLLGGCARLVEVTLHGLVDSLNFVFAISFP